MYESVHTLATINQPSFWVLMVISSEFWSRCWQIRFSPCITLIAFSWITEMITLQQAIPHITLITVFSHHRHYRMFWISSTLMEDWDISWKQNVCFHHSSMVIKLIKQYLKSQWLHLIGWARLKKERTRKKKIIKSMKIGTGEELTISKTVKYFW